MGAPSWKSALSLFGFLNCLHCDPPALTGLRRVSSSKELCRSSAEKTKKRGVPRGDSVATVQNNCSDPAGKYDEALVELRQANDMQPVANAVSQSLFMKEKSMTSPVWEILPPISTPHLAILPLKSPATADTANRFFRTRQESKTFRPRGIFCHWSGLFEFGGAAFEFSPPEGLPHQTSQTANVRFH